MSELQARWVDRRGGQATLWAAALMVTVMLAGYQRLTGPTHPIRVRTQVGGAVVAGQLQRSQNTDDGGVLVALFAPDRAVSGAVRWRRFPTDDEWRSIPLARLHTRLVVELPLLPPAGKLEYLVQLVRNGETITLPASGAAVARYKGPVPGTILAPHVLAMFLGLVIGVRVLLGGLANEDHPERRLPWLLAFMVPGGLILGPIVQQYAFGAFWTGWPLGDDLTDTKTLASVLAWAAAWLVSRWLPRAKRGAILAAALVMLAAYLIPHSLHGSQIDWSQTPPPAVEQQP